LSYADFIVLRINGEALDRHHVRLNMQALSCYS